MLDTCLIKGSGFFLYKGNVSYQYSIRKTLRSPKLYSLIKKEFKIPGVSRAKLYFTMLAEKGQNTTW